MPTFRRLPISRRLWLIVLVAVAMLLAMSVLLLRQSYDDLYAGKVLKPSMWWKAYRASSNTSMRCSSAAN